MKFSVVIPFYINCNPDYAKLALHSIWHDQILKPDEIVIVKDGPLSQKLEMVISEFTKECLVVKFVCLPKNMGLGIALKNGVENCSYELIARMDSDDISLPHRFQIQTEFMLKNPTIDIVGSYIGEFLDDPGKIVSYRNGPITHYDIRKYAKRRNPMNHMTIMYKKSKVLEAGNYELVNGYDDYYLWIKMLNVSAVFANIPEVTVFARIGNNLAARRQGLELFKNEFVIQNMILHSKFIGIFTYGTNLLFRAFPRLLPVPIVKVLYKFIRS